MICGSGLPFMATPERPVRVGRWQRLSLCCAACSLPPAGSGQGRCVHSHLAGEAAALRAQLSKERGPSTPAASALTAAELRVLPMLAMHLSFREIGAEMFLSQHTVKSQAMSIYRKLGASSRNQAVTRSRELGLLDG